MHKVLLLLGMLLRRSLYGYEMHQIVRAHGELYADLKKANLYYLLDRLAAEGDLVMQVEEGAHGERRRYSITDAGRAHFYQLLHEILLTYDPVHTGIDTAVVFLGSLPHAEGISLLEQRLGIVRERLSQVQASLGDMSGGPLMYIASDHLVSLMEAEVNWIERSLTYLRNSGWAGQSSEQAHHTGGTP